jgi:hypothetical protein
VLRAVVAKPAWFGGAVALDATFTQPPNVAEFARIQPDVARLNSCEFSYWQALSALPVRNQALRGKRVLLATSNADAEPQHALGRLLNASGMAVALRLRDNGAAALADINEWLMEGICIAV